MASGTIQEIGEANFTQVVESADVPVLLDFWASWCAPCRALAPIIDEIAEEMGDQIVVGKVNTDNEGVLATKFGIRSIPTLIIFKSGGEVNRLVGLRNKEEIKAALTEQL